MNAPDPADQKPTHPGDDANDLLCGPTDNEWETDRDLIDQRLADPWEEQQ